MKIPKTPKGRKTKQKILDASITLINKRGFAKVTLNDMCEASGVAIGTFYHYFTSTQAVLYEILAVEAERVLKYYKGLRERSPVKKLKKVLAYQIDYFETKGKEVVGHIYGMEIDSRHGSTRLLEIMPIMRILEELILKGLEAGELKAGLDPHRCAMMLLSLILGYSFAWLSEDEPRTLRELAYDHLLEEIDRMRKVPA